MRTINADKFIAALKSAYEITDSNSVANTSDPYLASCYGAIKMTLASIMIAAELASEVHDGH